MVRYKRPRRYGRFSGTSCGGRGWFGKGHHSRPSYSTKHVAYGIVAQSSFSTLVPLSLSALPVSLYRALSI